MHRLNELKNTTRPLKQSKRVGRGMGSKRGKTCGRGEKGAGSRAGYKRRYGKEGGVMPLFMKLPIRGFSNASFQKRLDIVNLSDLDRTFNDGESVTLETLREKGLVRGPCNGVKLLGCGELTKKVAISLQAVSQGAAEKLRQANISFEVK